MRHFWHESLRASTLQFHTTHGDSVCKPYQSVQLFDSRNSILHVKCDISDMRALEHQPYSSIKHTGIVFANPISSVSSVSCSILGTQFCKPYQFSQFSSVSCSICKPYQIELWRLRLSSGGSDWGLEAQIELLNRNGYGWNPNLHYKRVTLTLHELREKELTVPKNIREHCLQTLEFHKTHGDSVCKPYELSQFSQSVSCSILGRRM